MHCLNIKTGCGKKYFRTGRPLVLHAGIDISSNKSGKNDIAKFKDYEVNSIYRYASSRSKVVK